MGRPKSDLNRQLIEHFICDNLYTDCNLHIFCLISDNGPRSGKRPTKKSAGRMNDTDQETIKDLCKSLSASDWTSRLQGIEQFREICETQTSLITNSIVKVSMIRREHFSQ